MSEIKTDARVRYTKATIRSVFLSMLESMLLSQITVSEICKRAQINRATFYKYYDNPYDLLNQIENEEIDALVSKLKEKADIELHEIFRTVFEIVGENRALYRILFAENKDATFRQRIFSVCYESNIEAVKKHFPDLDGPRQQMIYYFIAEGCNGILNKWLFEDIKMPMEEVISFMDTLIESINACRLKD